MKITKGIIAVFLFAGIVSSCQKVKPFGIKGKGNVVSEIRNLQGFTEIDLDIDATVEFYQDSTYYVEVQAQSNLLPYLETKINDGELEIEFDHWVRSHKDIKIIIHAPTIHKLEISGSGSILAKNTIQTAHFKTEISGSGKIAIQEIHTTNYESDISGSGKVEVFGGTIENSEIEISGSGDQEMVGAESKHATIEISGSGTTKLTCTETLDVRISGSGKVYYSGNPSVQVNISGSGELIQL